MADDIDFFVRRTSAYDHIESLDDLAVMESLKGRYILPGIAGWLHHGRPIPIAGPGKMALLESGIRCSAYRPASMPEVLKQMFTIGVTAIGGAITILGLLWFGLNPELSQISVFVGFIMTVLLIFLVLYLKGYLRKFYRPSRDVDFVIPWSNIGNISLAHPSDLFESVNGPVIQLENKETDHKLYFAPDGSYEAFMTRLERLRE